MGREKGRVDYNIYMGEMEMRLKYGNIGSGCLTDRWVDGERVFKGEWGRWCRGKM